MPVDLSAANSQGSSPPKYRSFLLPIIAFELLVVGLTMARAIMRGKSPMRYFGEAGIISWLSFLQLLVLAALSLWIFLMRKRGAPVKWTAPQALWQWMAIGFFFLAVDEIAQIHEMLDSSFHSFFQIQENRLTDSIDDLIVLLYGVAGGYILYLFRQEFKRYRPAFKLVTYAFISAAIMVVFDVFTNIDPESNIDAFKVFFSDLESRHALLVWLQATEEVFKILAEGFFIAAFAICLQIARQLNQSTPTNADSE
ncbi:MAG: hypothetical protein AAGA67_08685 [Cyanobacteria bacterium P01_F01_bin.153]